MILFAKFFAYVHFFFLGRRSIAFSRSIRESLAPKKLRTTQPLGDKVETFLYILCSCNLSGAHPESQVYESREDQGFFLSRQKFYSWESMLVGRGISFYTSAGLEYIKEI